MTKRRYTMTEKIIKTDIANGVVGVFIPTKRFKTARLSVEFELPLREETASANALLPFMLTGSSKEYPSKSRMFLRKARRFAGFEDVDCIN